MRMLAVLGFIAGAAALAVLLFRTPTVADGRVLEADLLADLRAHGVATLVCDREIPIGVAGATFGCEVTLASGEARAAQVVMSRAGGFTWTLAPVERREPDGIPPSGDPWAN